VARSNSQLSEVTPLERIAYLWRLLTINFERRHLVRDIFEACADDLDFYQKAFAAETGRDLQDARILEVGYGQRPFRLIMLHSVGYDVRGVDLDRPLLSLNPMAVASVMRTNGALRATKSLVRCIAFDRSHYQAFDAFIRERYGKTLSIAPETMLVGNAASPDIWARAGERLDFVYSDNVVEHIPREQLASVLAQMAESLSDRGLAVIAPMVYTGIAGGHDLGWGPHEVDVDGLERGPAWGHLTGESRPADTYLNKMTLRDYRELFGERFDIVREQHSLADIGRRYLTAERRQLLRDFSEEELFSNHIRFVLRKKAR
jgi:2-polyprenyl-3-methyl-5-hydroxy-6-metoxy-1,4-benzoquinol methylase